MATPTKGAATAAPDVVWRGNGFGSTSRRDNWWVSPLLVFPRIRRPSSSTPPGRPFRTATTRRPVHLAVLFAGDLRRLPARLVRSEARLVSGLSAVLSGAAHSLDSRGFSALPATTTAAPTTKRSGPIPGLRRRRAAQDLPGRAKLPADHAELSPLLSAPLLSGLGLPGLRCREGLLVLRMASASASAPSCSPSMSFCWRLRLRLSRLPPPGRRASIRSRSIRSGTSSTIA